MGRMHAFENGALMLRNLNAPFLNASDVRRKVVTFGVNFWRRKRLTPRDRAVFVASDCNRDETKMVAIFKRIEKRRPEIEQIYIYICIWRHML